MELEYNIDGQSVRVTIPQGKTIVGRKNADIMIQNESISSNHLLLNVEGENVYFKDLNSTNGTFLNGERVTSGELHDGDMLMLGNVKMFAVGGEIVIDQPDDEAGALVIAEPPPIDGKFHETSFPRVQVLPPSIPNPNRNIMMVIYIVAGTLFLTIMLLLILPNNNQNIQLSQNQHIFAFQDYQVCFWFALQIVGLVALLK